MSASCVSRLVVRTSEVRFGAEVASVGERCEMRLRARRSVCRRGLSGRLVRVVMELSVRSMQSWSCLGSGLVCVFFLYVDFSFGALYVREKYLLLRLQGSR
jgi:hypothetical protein